MDWSERAARSEIEGLRRALARAEERILALEYDLQHGTSPEEDLFRSVGLSPEAIPIVVNAARRALLAHWHPDRWPDDQKEFASECFRAAQDVFDWIGKIRTASAGEAVR